MEVGAGRTQPSAPLDVPVEWGKSLLAVAVDVVGDGQPRLLHGGEKRPEKRVVYWPALNTSGPPVPRNSSPPARQVSIFLKYGKQWA